MRFLPTSLGLRSRLMLLVVSATGVALVLGAAVMLWTVSLSARRSLDDGARRAADEVVDMIDADRLPDPIPAAGSHQIQVIDTSNRVVAGSSGTDRLVSILEPDELRSAVDGTVMWMDGDRAGLDGPVRVLVRHCRVLRWSGRTDRPAVVVVAPAGEIIRSTNILRSALLVTLPLLLVLVGALAWRMITLTLRPVEALRAGAEEITGTRGTGRLPVPRTQDEIHRLALTLNGMLDRLERARAQQRAFIGDAAHELRSPLASIQTQLEVSQRLAVRDGHVVPGGATGADRPEDRQDGSQDRQGRRDSRPGNHPSEDLWARLVPDLLAETARMSRLVEDLLLLARADDTGPACLRTERTDAGTLIDRHIVRYESARVPVTRSFPRGGTSEQREGRDLLVEVDPDALRRVLTNLLDNAVRHARTSVTVDVHRRKQGIVIEVRDDGPGIPQEDRARAFDRFTRFDEARTRDEGGSGLGLAIVAELVRLHGGRVELGDALPGLVAAVHLPDPATGSGHGRPPAAGPAPTRSGPDGTRRGIF